MDKIIRKLSAALLCLLLSPLSAGAQWDFSRHAIPVSEIESGGPPKDGIPALTSPKYVPVKQADFLHADDQVIGVFLNGVARAYPTRILSWHELVNDTFGNEPVLVSW
jgi:hypothetical protein